MPNKKRKCTACKEYFLADEGITLPVGWFHNIDCAKSYAINKREKEKKKQLARKEKETRKWHRKEKRKFYDNDSKTRKAAAKKACHAYIRERDKNNNCICCDRPLGKNYDAGHFLESGNNSKLRYHEDNIHAQSVHCNQYKGGDSGNYEVNLRAKIGDKRVEWLKANKGGIVKRTAQDYKDIEIFFKNKLKELLND